MNALFVLPAHPLMVPGAGLVSHDRLERRAGSTSSAANPAGRQGWTRAALIAAAVLVRSAG
jgi:hypothetical protein